MNYVYKMAFLASENAFFLNEQSDGRVYANYEEFLNWLETKHLSLHDIKLVFKKALFTLQRGPFDTLTRPSSLAH